MGTQELGVAGSVTGRDARRQQSTPPTPPRFCSFWRRSLIGRPGPDRLIDSRGSGPKVWGRPRFRERVVDPGVATQNPNQSCSASRSSSGSFGHWCPTS